MGGGGLCKHGEAIGWGSGGPMVAEPMGARSQADETGRPGGVPGGGAIGGSPLGRVGPEPAWLTVTGVG